MFQKTNSNRLESTYCPPSDSRYLIRKLYQNLVPKTSADSSRLDVSDWIEKHFYIPENNGPMVLAPYQKRLLAFIFDGVPGPLPWTTVVWSETKKSGKSALAAAVARWWAESQEPYNEIYCCANDFEQAQGRNFAAMRRSIEMAADPKWGAPEDVMQNALAWSTTGRVLTYSMNGTFVQALSGDYRGAAGGNPGMIVFSELWGYVSEASRRLYGEMTTVPTRQNSFRWIETYAGWESESSELENLYELGMAGEPLAEFDDLRDETGEPEVRINRAAGLFMFWSHTPRQPWLLGERGDRYYAGQRATLRNAEFRRFHRNEWVSREGGFIEPRQWDTLPHLGVRLEELVAASDRPVEIVLAADASKNRDSTALVGVVVSDNETSPRAPFIDLAYVRVWDPALDPDLGVEMIDLDQTIGAELQGLIEDKRVRIKCIAYDPYQLHSIMVTLAKTYKVDVVEIPQTERRVQTDTNLYDLIMQRRLRPYFDTSLREHVLNAVALKRPRGIRLDKELTSKHIDAAVALSMAAWAALFYSPARKRKYLKV